jgi:tetratricopeptide (TPR) repeat protein
VNANERDPLPSVLERLKKADASSALKVLEEAAAEHPSDTRLLLLLAAQLVHAQQLDRAEAVYSLALQLQPDFAIARFQLGLLQLSSGRPAIARLTWGPLEALGAEHPLRLFKTGLEHLSEDRFVEARRCLEEGIARNQENLPLNGDMRKVLERIAAVAPASAQSSAQEHGTEEHVLVSSYRNRF